MEIILSTGNIMGGTAGSISPSTRKSNLELIHSLRLNISDAIAQAAAPPTNGSSSTTPPPWQRWTTQTGTTLLVPSIDFSQSHLLEPRPAYDITAKLFFLRPTQPATRARHAAAALALVLQELHVPDVDLLIASFPGIHLDDSDSAPRGDHPADPPAALAETWTAALRPLRDAGTAARLGVAELGEERLRDLLGRCAREGEVAVDQINLRDCCGVPRGLLGLARERGVELLVHNDCSDVLPRGTVREMLGQGEGGAGVLGGEEGVGGEVLPAWVVKYTAVVRDRGVVENKGYFAMAEVVS